MSFQHLLDQAADLFEKKSLAQLATVGANGMPQVTPVWIDREGELLKVNTAVGRVKERNVRANPRVGLLISDPDNVYRFLSVQGTAEFRTEGADAHIDALAKRYLGQDRYPNRVPGEQRIIMLIHPEKMFGRGLEG